MKFESYKAIRDIYLFDPNSHLNTVFNGYSHSFLFKITNTPLIGNEISHFDLFSGSI